jgi:hypothetical protein
LIRQQSINRISIITITVDVAIVFISISRLLLLWFLLMPLSPNFIVITDVCVVAAVAVVVFVVATVALFLLSSLTFVLLLPLFGTVFLSIADFCDNSNKHNASKEEHQAEGPTSPYR